MATKTISLRLDAYQRLCRARRNPDESFTQVVLRAEWPEVSLTARELRSVYASEGPFFEDDELDQIAKAEAGDRPPADKWAEEPEG